MRLIVCLIVLCVFIAGCRHNGEPSSAQIEAAVNEALKKKNPDAAAKITSIEIESPYFYEEFKFSCSNCVMEFKDGERHVVPSCEGHGMVRFDHNTQDWKFDRIVVTSQGIGKVIYESDHVF